VGVYAFSKYSLAAFAKAPSGVLERAERLEQLRILEMGERIIAGVIDRAAPGIDTPEDYRLFVARVGKGAA
jgi:3-deoxy-manno-octulosonate cytidylyltransferase (CMP-KDO synthetase)